MAQAPVTLPQHNHHQWTWDSGPPFTDNLGSCLSQCLLAVLLHEPCGRERCDGSETSGVLRLRLPSNEAPPWPRCCQTFLRTTTFPPTLSSCWESLPLLRTLRLFLFVFVMFRYRVTWILNVEKQTKKVFSQDFQLLYRYLPARNQCGGHMYIYRKTRWHILMGKNTNHI